MAEEIVQAPRRGARAEMSEAERTEAQAQTRELARMLFLSVQEREDDGDSTRDAVREQMRQSRREAWERERQVYMMQARRLMRLIERNERITLGFDLPEEARRPRRRPGDEG